jgi:hypothetical protein
MREHGENPRRHKAVDRAQGTRRLPSQGLAIEPPPQETGPEQLYRVIYVIDVNAPNPQRAAQCAYEIMSDPAAIRPVLDILDSSGRCTRVDLSEE